MTFRIPWNLERIDPHAADDMCAAFFGSALFDGLYRENEDASGIEPSLAADLPREENDGCTVSLREGLVTAAGRSIEAREVVSSMDRTARFGGTAWAFSIPKPTVTETGQLRFKVRDGKHLARVLASPWMAIVPRGFSPSTPDGTGPFRARITHDGLMLVRNDRSACGSSYLDELRIYRASDLSDSLRSFEAARDDLGWHGLGLYDKRRGARAFDAGTVGWIVLRVGRDAGAWDAPGVAQSIADGILPESFAPFRMGPSWPRGDAAAWGGAPVDLLVPEREPFLADVAKQVAASISTPGHEVSVRSENKAAFARRLRDRSFAFAVHAMARPARGARGAFAAILAIDDPNHARLRMKGAPQGDVSPRVLSRMTRLGVLGDVNVVGGVTNDVALPLLSAGGVAWGSVFRRGP